MQLNEKDTSKVSTISI